MIEEIFAGFLCSKDAGIMAISGPSCNTDQGVDQSRKCLGMFKPLRGMKVNVGGTPF